MKSDIQHTETSSVFDEFSPKKFILLFNQSSRYLLSKWLIILIVGVLFGIAGAVKSYFTKPVYKAQITFTLDEGNNQFPKSNYAQLAEQLGLPTMNTAGGVFNNITNILELMKSRLLIEKTLRSVVVINKKPIVLANFFLDSLDYRDKWMKGSPYYKMSFATAAKNENDSLFRNGIMSNIYETLLAKNLEINSKGSSTSIVAVSCNSEHELFSKYFLESLVNEVTSYYIETKTQRALINVQFLEKRIDSVRNVYTSTLYTKAASTDANVNIAKQTATVGSSKKETDIQISKSAYAELVGSLESARTVLMRETPLFQYIDMPILPLKVQRASLTKDFVLFFIIGSVITMGFLVVRKFFKFILSH